MKHVFLDHLDCIVAMEVWMNKLFCGDNAIQMRYKRAQECIHKDFSFVFEEKKRVGRTTNTKQYMQL